MLKETAVWANLDGKQMGSIETIEDFLRFSGRFLTTTMLGSDSLSQLSRAHNRCPSFQPRVRLSHCGTNKSRGRKLPIIEYTPKTDSGKYIGNGSRESCTENTWGEIPLNNLSMATLLVVSTTGLGSRDAESKSDQASAGSQWIPSGNFST